MQSLAPRSVAGRVFSVQTIVCETMSAKETGTGSDFSSPDSGLNCKTNQKRQKYPHHKSSKCDGFCLTGICLIQALSVLFVLTSIVNEKTKQSLEEAEFILNLLRLMCKDYDKANSHSF